MNRLGGTNVVDRVFFVKIIHFFSLFRVDKGIIGLYIKGSRFMVRDGKQLIILEKESDYV